MRESKQDQFRIGGVYFNGCGSAVRLDACDNEGEATCWLVHSNWDFTECRIRLADGAAFVEGTARDLSLNLRAGELQQVGSRWVRIEEEKPEAPKPAATLGELLRRALDRPLVRPGMTFVAEVPDGLSVTPADLAMVARDGLPKPAAVVIPKPVEPTAKPAISGLQREYSSTHLLGSYR